MTDVRADRVSVALASHNGAEFLVQQIDSILDQSRPVDEIVISDDASTDDTMSVAKRCLATFTGDIHYLHNDCALGVTRNFEQALRACTGEVIFLTDQDDVWHPDKVSAVLDAFGDNQMVFTNALLIDSRGEEFSGGVTLFDALGISDWERNQCQNGQSWPVLMRRNIVTGATTAIKRSLLDAAGEFPTSWVHDEWLAVVAASRGALGILDECLLDYRQHDANQIGVSKITNSTRIHRLRTPRTQRNARLLARASDLADRSQAWGAARHAEAMQKLAHEKVRSALPVGKLARISPVLAEKKTGRYEFYGLGMQDVVRDLMQPV